MCELDKNVRIGHEMLYVRIETWMWELNTRELDIYVRIRHICKKWVWKLPGLWEMEIILRIKKNLRIDFEGMNWKPSWELDIFERIVHTL